MILPLGESDRQSPDHLLGEPAVYLQRLQGLRLTPRAFNGHSGGLACTMNSHR